MIRETRILEMFSLVGSPIVLHGELSVHDSVVLGVLGSNWRGAYAAVFPSVSPLINVPEQCLSEQRAWIAEVVDVAAPISGKFLATDLDT